jgi:hypothetical protein
VTGAEAVNTFPAGIGIPFFWKISFANIQKVYIKILPNIIPAGINLLIVETSILQIIQSA